MSTWTHVCGAIRLDALRGTDDTSIKSVIKEKFGTMAHYHDSEKTWDKCTVPMGSEGSLTYVIWENPDSSCLAAYTVSIFGDLRDFGADRIGEIESWLKKALNSKHYFIRQGTILVSPEDGNYESWVIDYHYVNKKIVWDITKNIIERRPYDT